MKHNQEDLQPERKYAGQRRENSVGHDRILCTCFF